MSEQIQHLVSKDTSGTRCNTNTGVTNVTIVQRKCEAVRIMNKELYKYMIPCGADKTVSDDGRGHIVGFRCGVAREEANKNKITREEIIQYIKEIQKLVGMKEVCFEYQITNPKRKVPYYKISVEYGSEDKRDIVWLKFTTDGYLGAVCVSNDVNFSYENTSGKIISSLNKYWDETSVILVPLCNIPDQLDRRTIESSIGNYLIEKGVPILDYYSHNM